MKKLIAIFLTLIMALSLAACGGEPASPANNTEDPANPPANNGGTDTPPSGNDTQDLDNTTSDTFTPPDFIFVMDGITLGETKMNDVRAKHGGDDFWIHGEDINYPIGTSLAYWFQSDYTTNNFVGRMGYANPALSWLFFEKYHVGDNASAILLDITGLSALSSLRMGKNEVFNSGNKQIFVEKYSDNQYYLYYIKGAYEAEIQIYDNIIIKVTMGPVEIHHSGNGVTVHDNSTPSTPDATQPPVPSEYAITIINNTGKDLYELTITLLDYANNENPNGKGLIEYFESTKNTEDRINADGYYVYDGIVLANGASAVYVLEGVYGGSTATLVIRPQVGAYQEAEVPYNIRIENGGVRSGSTIVILPDKKYEVK